MQQRAILHRILSVAVVIGLLLAATAQPALAVPPLPSDFWGYVTVDGAPAAAGTAVAATVNGVTFQAVTQMSGGQAIYSLSANGDDSATPGVEGGVDGQAVAFGVGGVAVSQAGVWRSGSSVQLDLARTSAPAVLLSASPTSAALGANATITVVGRDTNFAAGVTQVSFGPGVTINSVSVISRTQLTTNISVPANAAPGKRTVTATTGAEVASKSNAFTVLANTLPVYLPANASGAVGADVTIPITLPANLTGRTIVAYSVQVTADPAVLQFTGASKTGTLSGDWSVQERHDLPGQISVVAFGTTNLGSDGVLLNLLARVDGSNGATTPLQFAAFTFNEGTPAASTQNGSFTSSGLAIVGGVTYAGGSVPVSGTVMTLSGGAAMTTTVDANGVYRLPVAAGKNYVVTPSSSRYSGGAISALDAARVAQCILGVLPMSDCPLSSADINNSKSVTAYDASVIARYAVGLTSPVSLIGNWVYEPPSRSFTNVQASQLDQNHRAFVRGDVTANWGQAGVAAAAAGPALVAAVARPDTAGQMVVLLRLGGPPPDGMIAYDFSVQYDPEQLQLAAIDGQGTLSGDWEIAWNEDAPGRVRVAAFHAQPLAGSGDLLRLVFDLPAASGEPPAPLAVITVSPISFNEGAAVLDVATDYGAFLNPRLYLPEVLSEP